MFPIHTLIWQYRGLLVAFSASTAMVLMDICGQYLQSIDPIDVNSLMIMRMLPSLVGTYGWLYLRDEPLYPEDRSKRWWIGLRSCSMWLTLLLFFHAVRHISMSDAMTLFQARPFIVGYLSQMYLGERMNGVQKIASTVSLLGEVLIAKPTMLFTQPSKIVISGPDSIANSSTADHLISYAIIVGCVFLTSLDLLILRKIGGDVHDFILLGGYSLASVILSGSLLVLTQSPLLISQTGLAWVLLFCVQVFGVLTQILLTCALKLETAVTMTLVSQTQVVPAALCEWAGFHTHFDSLSTMGATLSTVAGGVAIVYGPSKQVDEVIQDTEMPLLRATSEDAELGEERHDIDQAAAD